MNPTKPIFRVIRLLCSCVVTLLVLVTLTSCDPSSGISLGGLSLSFGSGGNKGWASQPSHGWAPAPAKGWAPAPAPKAAPSVSISIPKPNIGQLLAIPLKVLQYKLNALGNQQISFKFTLPRISISKPAPAPQPWAPAPQPWAPAPQGWASAPQPQPWSPPPQGWKPEPQGWKPEPQEWKTQPQPAETWKSAPPKGWQPPAGWKPPQGWQQENTVKSAGWNKK